MARTTLQLCREIFLTEMCANRSCELAENSELKFVLVLSPEDLFGKLDRIPLDFCYGRGCACLLCCCFLIIPF